MYHLIKCVIFNTVTHVNFYWYGYIHYKMKFEKNHMELQMEGGNKWCKECEKISKKIISFFTANIFL